MNYNYRYRMNPTAAQTERLAWTVDTCRQVRNHFLHRLNRVDDTTKYGEINRLPDMKEWWPKLQEVYSRTLQNVVERLYDNLSTLKGLKDNGHKVGQLKWKGKGYYRSFTYRQSGFELKKTSDHDCLRLSKIGEIPITLHREIPDGAKLKQVTVKREPTGEWFAVFGIETDDEPPEPPAVRSGSSRSTWASSSTLTTRTEPPSNRLT